MAEKIGPIGPEISRIVNLDIVYFAGKDESGKMVRRSTEEKVRFLKML